MNKSMKRLVSVLLAMLVLSALGVSALAEGESYTITVSTGNIAGAELQGQTSYTANYGESVPLGEVLLPDDSPYYFKGFRPAGQDNSVVYSPTVYVTEDADYVAAYGLQGDLVAYTVQYVDENGNQLESSETHYGNKGDKMVVRARNIDGYQPQAYQLAKTLVEDESQNVFPFVYSRVVIVTPEPAPSPTPYVYTEGAATAPEAAETEQIGGGAAPAGGGAAAPAPEAAGGAEAEAEPEQAPAQQPAQEPAQEQQTQQITEDETPLNNGPAEMIDLDDTPLGDTPEIKEKPKTELQQERAEKETKLYVAGGLLAAALATIVVLVVLLVRKRKA